VGFVLNVFQGKVKRRLDPYYALSEYSICVYTLCVIEDMSSLKYFKDIFKNIKIEEDENGC
jgi:hypothetical protein